MKEISILLVLLLLCGCSSNNISDKSTIKKNETKEENVIEINDKASNIAKKVNDLEKTELESGGNHYYNKDLVIISNEDDSVSQMTYSTDKYTTSEGTKVGDSFDKIDKLYKKDDTKYVIYDISENPIYLTVEKDNTIIQYDFKNKKVASISITEK